MTSMWARVCELCGAIGVADRSQPAAALHKAPEGWLHQEVGVFQASRTIDVCAACCATKTIGALRDSIAARQETAVVMSGGNR